MTKTIPMNYVGKTLIGYGVGAYLSRPSQEIVTSLLEQLTSELPGILWPMPPGDLHITLFEIIVSLGEYEGDRDKIYEKHRPAIEQELDNLLSQMEPIKVDFTRLEASPAAIIVKGTDDGSMQTIRDKIVSKSLLPSETKLPPGIIHSTIARYIKEIDLDHVQEVLKHHSVNFEETIHEFKLERATGAPMAGVTTLKLYPLKGGI